jgi:hypothetical protein
VIKPLCILYPVLYDLCLNPKCSVHEVYMNECVIPFKVTLLPVIRDQWYDLARKLNIIEIREEEDFF